MKNKYEDKIFTIPNIITTARILASGAIFSYILASGITVSIPLAVLTSFVGATDFVDGYIARKYNMGSKLGRVLDPVADKFFNWGLGITLMASGAMPLWPLAIAVRDIGVSSFYSYQNLKKGRKDLAPTWPAKIKMGLQSIATVGTLAFGFGGAGLSMIAPMAMAAATATVVPEIVAIKKKYFSKKKVEEETKDDFVPQKIEEDPIREESNIFKFEKPKVKEKNKTLVKVKRRDGEVV